MYKAYFVDRFRCNLAYNCIPKQIKSVGEQKWPDKFIMVTL